MCRSELIGGASHHIVSPMGRKTAHFSLRIDPKVKLAAEKAAAADRRSLSSLTEVLLAKHCKEREPSMEDRALPKKGKGP